jgi:hypothetical protein
MYAGVPMRVLGIESNPDLGLPLPGVRLVTWTTPGVINWSFDCNIMWKVPTLPRLGVAKVADLQLRRRTAEIDHRVAAPVEFDSKTLKPVSVIGSRVETRRAFKRYGSNWI